MYFALVFDIDTIFCFLFDQKITTLLKKKKFILLLIFVI